MLSTFRDLSTLNNATIGTRPGPDLATTMNQGSAIRIHVFVRGIQNVPGFPLDNWLHLLEIFHSSTQYTDCVFLLLDASVH